MSFDDSDDGFGSGLQLPLDSRLAGWDVEPGFEPDFELRKKNSFIRSLTTTNRLYLVDPKPLMWT